MLRDIRGRPDAPSMNPRLNRTIITTAQAAATVPKEANDDLCENTPFFLFVLTVLHCFPCPHSIILSFFPSCGTESISD